MRAVMLNSTWAVRNEARVQHPVSADLIRALQPAKFWANLRNLAIGKRWPPEGTRLTASKRAYDQRIWAAVTPHILRALNINTLLRTHSRNRQ